MHFDQRTYVLSTYSGQLAVKQERIVQETLEAVTWPGEALLGFARCRHNPGELLKKEYYIGLTPRRFLLVRKDHPERVYSIYRSYIHRVVTCGAGMFHPAGFEIQVGGDTLWLEAAQSWNQRAFQMVEKHNAWEAESPYLTATQFLDGMTDLADLGMVRSAQVLLRNHRAINPVLEIEPRAEDLDVHLTQGRLSLWLTLIMLVIALLYIIGCVYWKATWAGFGILPVILLVLAAERLVRWQMTWRGLALSFTLMATLVNLASSGASGSFLNGSVWAAFGAASLLALTGKTSRLRNLTATAIFTLGFLAPLVVTGAVTAATPPARFSDDFSTNQGWITRDSTMHTSRIEDGAYAIAVKESSETFFAFPPLSFIPTSVDFEALVPEHFQGKVGTYGVTCGYQDSGAVYLVEIDPAGNHYAFLRFDGKRSSPINGVYWHPLAGAQNVEGATRVKVRCAGKGISLVVNGIEQGHTWVTDLVPDGKMGIFVRTWPETGADGFKVLYDNVVFRDEKGK
jgi:hypothetical protein